MLYSSCVVGNKAFFWGENTTIVSTSDGGETFIVYPAYSPIGNVAWTGLQPIAFADSLTGYLTDVPHGEFRTTDGGVHWVRVAGPYSNVEIVTFANSQVGWKFGNGGGSFKTTNAGLTWSPFNTPFQFNQGGFFSRVYALDQDRLWVLKRSYSGVTGVSGVWSSSNGGSSWQHVNTGLVMDSTQQLSNVDLKVKASGLGIGIGYLSHMYSDSVRSFVLRTTDFGVSWTRTFVPKVRLRTVLSINDSIWVVLGNETVSPALVVQLRSTDFGLTWQSTLSPFPGPNYHYVSSAEYLPDERIILVCGIRSFYRSSDLGLTYSKLTNNTDMVVSDFAIDRQATSGEQLVVAISPTYTTRDYLLSSDGGGTWVKRSIPTNIGVQIGEVSIANGAIVIVANNSTLARSMDKGLTWTRIPVDSYGCLRALDVLDSSRIVAVGYSGSTKLFSTSDGGTRWISAPLPSRYWLNELKALTSGRVLGCGGFYDSAAVNGILFETTDGGFDWHMREVTGETKHIVMSSAKTGFAVSTYRVYRTTDAGHTWSLNRSSNDYFTPFSNLAFSDSLHGVLREAYYFVETSNGGISWNNTPLNVPSWGSVRRMAYNNRGELLVLTESAAFLRYTGETGSAPGGHLPNTGPAGFELSQNYPNPFNPSTTIMYSLPHSAEVTLRIYNVLGQLVTTITEKHQVAGTYTYVWNGEGLASGLYFVRIDAGDFTATRKALLLK
jgi:photosystem II stability/assembly factor-like uncharacterized protein